MLRFLGDINYCDGYFDTDVGTGSLIRKGLKPLDNLSRNIDDFWIGNFEGVCSSVSELKGIKSKQFIIEPEAMRGLWHPDVYTVANNHVMQHGADAYLQMIQNLKSLNCIVVGSESHKSIRFSHQGKSVGLTAFSQRPENFPFGTLYWAMPEYSDILHEFESKLTNCDFKIAHIHWGNEFMNYPYIDQRQFAHWLIDIGFDLIIGMHPHILQGYEVYKGKHIFYSLGNTVFNMAWRKTKYGAIVNVDLLGEKPKVSYNYTKIGKDNSPRVVDEKDVPEDCRFSHLNSLIDHSNENEKYYSSLFRQMKIYRKANYRKIINEILRLKPSVIASMVAGFIRRRI